jgi:hypothetical protein
MFDGIDAATVTDVAPDDFGTDALDFNFLWYNDLIHFAFPFCKS